MRGCPDLFMGVEAEYEWLTVVKCSCPFGPSLYKAGYERERGRALHCHGPGECCLGVRGRRRSKLIC